MSTASAAISEACRVWLAAVLAPVEVPPGSTSREIVRGAIGFEQPPRVPYCFKVPLGTDFFELATLQRLLDRVSEPLRAPGTEYVDEWGVTYRKTRFSWDDAIGHPLPDLAGVDSHRLADVAAPQRTRRLEPFVRRAQQAGKYVVGADPVLLHERLCALMGFERAMTAPYRQRDAFESLLDRMTDLTVAAIERLGGLGGVDAFMTWQDHGLQSGPLMNPALFRQLYKPRYARAVAAAHRFGMDYIWHSCGQIAGLIPDMIDIGVDVVQLDQPRLIGHRQLAERFGGNICFWNTVDIQWAADPAVTAADVAAEVAAMLEPFSACGGGLMVRHYGDPDDIGLSQEFHRASYDAFMKHGCGRSARLQ
ncbi:MAG: hypothetical protein HY899_02270 [Deltaproteobacteria bacterium]|nr:hypothetical protein [Deltaproteobacteria bacterium]